MGGGINYFFCEVCMIQNQDEHHGHAQRMSRKMTLVRRVLVVGLVLLQMRTIERLCEIPHEGPFCGASLSFFLVFATTERLLYSIYNMTVIF